jgi:hypothetical protein
MRERRAERTLRRRPWLGFSRVRAGGSMPPVATLGTARPKTGKQSLGPLEGFLFLLHEGKRKTMRGSRCG